MPIEANPGPEPTCNPLIFLTSLFLPNRSAARADPAAAGSRQDRAPQLSARGDAAHDRLGQGPGPRTGEGPRSPLGPGMPNVTGGRLPGSMERAATTEHSPVVSMTGRLPKRAPDGCCCGCRWRSGSVPPSILPPSGSLRGGRPRASPWAARWWPCWPGTGQLPCRWRSVPRQSPSDLQLEPSRPYGWPIRCWPDPPRAPSRASSKCAKSASAPTASSSGH
jgi:hypothetical protein